LKPSTHKTLTKRATQLFWKGCELLLIVFERAWLLTDSKRFKNADCFPPVFIIGAPRSGTTLLYQLLVNRYKFVYFSNFTANFCRAPILATMMVRKSFWDIQTHVYTSKHGLIKGWAEPHEAGNFWYRWFPRGQYVYVAPGTTSRSVLIQIQQAVTGMGIVSGLPALYKNTYNSMRIAPVLEAFPEAYFLVCHRKPVDVAQSILKARIESSGNRENWWSLPPKEIKEIEKHPYWEQVVEQVYYTNKQITDDKKRFGARYFYDVNYKDMCCDTHEFLLGVEHFLVSKNISLIRHNNDVPTQFSFSTGQQVSDEDYQRINDRVQELWNG
jgi:hypothetical protein